MKTIKTITIDKSKVFASVRPTILDRLLPYMLILAFMWKDFYYIVSSCSTRLGFIAGSQSLGTVLVFGLLLCAIIEYAVMYLILWLYTKILSTRPYFYLVREAEFKRAYKLSYLGMLIIYGIINNMLFIAPYLKLYISWFALVLSFAMILCTFLLLRKKIDEMLRHLFFKMMVYPWFIYQIIILLLSLMLGGL
jgi:hypothetical protein